VIGEKNAYTTKCTYAVDINKEVHVLDCEDSLWPLDIFTEMIADPQLDKKPGLHEAKITINCYTDLTACGYEYDYDICIESTKVLYEITKE
jgi:hypothetical protein